MSEGLTIITLTLRMGARILPRVNIELASIVRARSSHIIIYDVHIFVIRYLVPTRLDGSLAKYLRGLFITPPTRPFTMGLNTTGHRRGEGDIFVRVDIDQRTHDWTPTSQKSLFLSTHIIFTSNVTTTLL
jgi:hypothetical protein